jgi:hypothetical protein
VQHLKYKIYSGTYLVQSGPGSKCRFLQHNCSFAASRVSVLAHFHSHARLPHQEERNEWVSAISQATARAKVRVLEESRTGTIDRVRWSCALVHNSSHFQVQRADGRDVGESVKKSCCSIWIAWRSRTVMYASVSMRSRSSLCC